MNPVLALVVANVIWGAASPLFKFALENIPPFTLAFIRFFFAATLFVPLALRHKQHVSLSQLLRICLSAFFGVTINIAFFFLALPLTNSINAPVIASSQPILLFFFSILFLREKFHKKIFLGILISFIGVLVIIFSPFFLNHGTTLMQKETALEGNIFLIVATCGSLLQTLIIKKVLAKVSHYIITYISFLFGAITFIPFMLLELGSWSFSQLNLNGWVGIVFGVFFSSALAYGLYMYGFSKIKAQEIGIFSYIDPIMAVIIAIPLLHEYPTPIFFLGTFCVFLGIVIAEGRLHWHPVHKLRRTRKT